MIKTALITGASGGIGSAIAHKLASHGYSLQLHYHQNRQKAEQIQEEIRSRHQVQVSIYQADLTKPEGTDHLVETLENTPDIIVHNAGLAHYALFTDIQTEDYDKMIQLHLTSPFKLTQQLLPTMISRRWGRIIFITSIWAETGASCEALYSMVKGGLTSLMKSLAKELAPSGITVNAVAPGVIDTQMMSSFTSDELQELYKEIPIGRMGNPAEVAHSVGFLIDEESSYMTGQVMRVNGGWYT
jgi:3-oxoacyl-[acyl-carrier protein] reductase